MAHSWILTRHLWHPNGIDTPPICITQNSNSSADDSARHGQNQEKETNSDS